MYVDAIGCDEDWEILGEKWWSNSFGTVTWAYPPPRRRTGSPASSPNPVTPRFKPPYYHDLLLRPHASRRGWSVCCDQCQELRDPLCPCEGRDAGGGGSGGGVELRRDLLGVEAVRQVLEAYESSVGIVTTDDRGAPVDIAALAVRVGLLNGDTPPTGLAQDQWRQQAEETFRDIVVPLDPDVLRDLLASPPDDAQPVLSFLDRQLDPSLPSEEEKEPLPETPKPRRDVPSIKEQVDMVLRKIELAAEREPEDSDSQDDMDALSMKRRLSRPPSSPSTTSSSPATSSSDELQSVSSYHTARTRSNSLPSVNLKRDDQGFYTSVDDDLSLDDPVPSFLVGHGHRSRKPMSKTRAMVDSMREGTEDEDEKRGALAFSVSRLFQRSGDGWIRMVSDDVPDMNKNFGLRTADPFHNPAEDASDLEDLWPMGSTLGSPFSDAKKLADKSVKHQPKHGRRASTMVTSSDGWIDTSNNKDVPKSTNMQRKHRSRSTQLHNPQGSAGKFVMPPLPPPPPMPMHNAGYPYPYPGPNMTYPSHAPPAFPAYAPPATLPAYHSAFAYPVLGAPGYAPPGHMFPTGGFGGPSIHPPWH
ncbi:hypothetical protein OF83DRAFT_1173212 [Amylostereum chailletii]|nr:hypothetical protein OF83DRAFT_1173212 [Amylostereum chailletii]